jgi:hypothetical protein
MGNMTRPTSDLLPATYTGGTIWHYTNTAGLIGIVESGTLWATGAAHLNDSREIGYGVELIGSVWNTLRRNYGEPTDRLVRSVLVRSGVEGSFDGAYVACASTSKDDLGHWRGYGNVAIGLNPDARLDLEEYSQLDGELQYPRAWRRVIYDPSEQQRVVAQVLTAIAESIEGAGDYAYLGSDPERMTSIYYGWMDVLLPLLKSPGFRSENEVRLSVGLPTFYPKGQSFRPGTFSVVPYVRITSADDPKRLPILEVQVGPTSHPTTARLGIQTLLTKHGYSASPYLDVREAGTLPITHSAVTFRS